MGSHGWDKTLSGLKIGESIGGYLVKVCEPKQSDPSKSQHADSGWRFQDPAGRTYYVRTCSKPRKCYTPTQGYYEIVTFWFWVEGKAFYGRQQTVTGTYATVRQIKKDHKD